MWMLSIQYFTTQLMTALVWANPYSIRLNTISDLGNTACGIYNMQTVCSPLHNYMNASFILLGLFIVAGSLLIHQEFRETRGSAAGFFCMALAGVGTLVVGLFPENTISALHIAGATLPFVFGNVAMLILGTTLPVPKLLKIYTVTSGFVGLAGLVLLLSKHYLGLGDGGMERVTAYPQTIWLIAFGLYISANHYVKRRASVMYRKKR